MGKQGGVIMDGRDIGTVVFPDADFKFFMIADVKTRAKRRWIEAQEKKENLSLEQIKQELIWRDKNDSTRANSPLKKAADAIEIDTSDLTISEQVAFLKKIIAGENETII
jgi:cytidylate kinase